MEKLELSEEIENFYELHQPFIFGEWVASCNGKRFILNNNGMKLAVREDEELEKIIFDVEKKTVSVRVKKPTLPTKVPRTADLSRDMEFFDELRKNIETILTTKDGEFKSVIPNEDRTEFEVS